MIRTSRRIQPWQIAALLAVLLLSGNIAAAARPKDQAQCFEETPYCFDDVFADYWNQNGGLPVFGFPITAAEEWAKPDSGSTLKIQWVERNRFELHPELVGTPYYVLLGLLGKQRLSQLGRSPDPAEAAAKTDCLWFAETGHNVCDQQAGVGFMSYWRAHGLKNPDLDAYGRSLQLFGLPLTTPRMETNSSGDYVLTQWFERARFEWHPGNPTPSRVLLGRLGSEAAQINQPPPAAAPTNQPIATPTATATASLTEAPPPPRNPTRTPKPTATPTSGSPPPTATSAPTVQPTATPWPTPRPPMYLLPDE